MSHPCAQAMSAPRDRVVRAITEDNTFRLVAASTTATLRGALAAADVAGPTAQHFGALLTGTILVRETMSPFYRVQGILVGQGGRGRLLADAHPDGRTRGLVTGTDDQTPFALGSGSVLQVMRTMANGQVYRGLVEASGLPDVPSVLMAYLQDSEQILSVIAVGQRGQGDEIERAGGYVVQLLPEAERSALQTMTRRLESLPSIETLLGDSDGEPEALLHAVVGDTPFAQLDDRPLEFGCWCTHESVVAALTALSRDELGELVREQEIIELSCDYCHQDYRVSRAQLRGLLESS